MSARKFDFDLGGRKVTVEAEPEGSCRYMVRLFEAGFGRTRIGYLTGQRRNWMVEFFGQRNAQPFSSAKAACRALAEWSLTQPGIIARNVGKAARNGG